MEILIGNAKAERSLVLVPGVGTKSAKAWIDEAGRPWLHSLPQSILAGTSAYEFVHGLDAGHLAWAQLLDKGYELLSQLIKLVDQQDLPIVIIAHSTGGFLVKKTLCLALEEGQQSSGLLKTLAGIVFLGTPHLTCSDDKVWDTLSYAVDQASKPRNSIEPEDRDNLAQLSTRFTQAAAELQILSCYELEATSVRSSWSWRFWIWTLQQFIAPRELVQLGLPRERFLGLQSNHGSLCDFDTRSRAFKGLISFLEEVLEKACHGTAKSAVECLSDLPATERSFDTTVRDLHAVSSFSSAPPIVRLPCFAVASIRNPDFYGRAVILGQLDQVFLQRCRVDIPDPFPCGRKPTTYALVGPGGIGKTQVATEFVHRRKDCFDAIFWVYADQPAKVANCFLKIALELGLVQENSSDAKDPVVVRDIVKGWMANPVKSNKTSGVSDGKASWLLVFDNADSVDIIRDYRPFDGPGCVLLTSRDQLHLDGIAHSVLEPFTPEDAFDFLVRLTNREVGPEERQAGVGITHKLGGIPLAMMQMAGIITRRDLSFVEFLVAYEERANQEELFRTKEHSPEHSQSDYDHTLASVWALEGLVHGRALLEVISFLDPDQFSESILTAFSARRDSSVESDPTLLHDYPRTTVEYQRARTELLQSSLVSPQSGSQSMSVHGLVQEVAQMKMTATRLRLAFRTCLHLLSVRWPFEAVGWQHSVSRWPACKELFPHVMRLMSLSKRIEGLENDVSTKFQLAKLLTGAGRFYHESGNSYEAQPILGTAQTLCEIVKSRLNDESFPEHTISNEEAQAILAEIHYNLGCVATETNNPAAAILHFTTFNIMIADVAHCDDKKKEYAISWNELGVANMMNGKWKEAEMCFHRSIEIMEEVDASAKELQSLPMVNLGLSYWLQGGRLEEANSTLMAGLKDREARYGVNDHESFITGRFLRAIGNVRADLAKAKADDSLLEESKEYHQKALSHYRDTVGNNHHRTADTCVKVAEHCIRLGRLDAAESLLEQALKVFAGRAVYKAELARTRFKKSHVLELRGLVEEAAVEREGSFSLLQSLTDLEGTTEADVSDGDFDEVLCFWSR